jgi:hypothetical protein
LASFFDGTLRAKIFEVKFLIYKKKPATQAIFSFEKGYFLADNSQKLTIFGFKKIDNFGYFW